MNIKLMEDTFTEKEFSAILDCLKSGEYTQGRRVDELEKKFAAWNGSKYAVMVNSGSSANLLMIAALKEKFGLRGGDEIIVPCVTWPTTIYPIVQNNLTPIFCDVDDSFNLDINSLKRMITRTEKVKAVFLVHLLGQPAKLNEIKQFCQEHNLFLLEDACESLGAKYDGIKYREIKYGGIKSEGIKVGNFGVMGSFSFYFGHHITTIEGGMIVTDDFKVYDLLKSMRSHGWVRNSPRAELYPEFEQKDFLFDLLGYNFRSTDLNAAIGLIQLEKLDEIIKIRRENHQYFLEKAKQIGLGYQQVNLDETSSFSLALLFSSKAERDYILKNLPKKGIECRPIVAGNLLRQPVFKYAQFKADAVPQADLIHDKGIYLPNNQFITKEKIDYMLEEIKKLLEEFKSGGGS